MLALRASVAEQSWMLAESDRWCKLTLISDPQQAALTQRTGHSRVLEMQQQQTLGRSWGL
jgi:hypothetical protein